MAHWTVTDNVISVDFQKAKPEPQLLGMDSAQIAALMVMRHLGLEFAAGELELLPDTAPSEYVAPPDDPA